MNENLFDNGILHVLVPQGWKLFYGIDSECNVSEKKLHIFKEAETEFDIFSRAGITICFYDKEDIFVSIKDIYDNVEDIEPIRLGEHLWEGYTCTSLGYPYAMLTSTCNGVIFYAMILIKNGEYEISLEDDDVKTILESISQAD